VLLLQNLFKTDSRKRDEDAHEGVSMDSLEDQVTLLNETATSAPQQFLEPTQNGMAVSMPSAGQFLTIDGGSVPVIALGVILSENIGGVVGRFTSQPTIVKWGSVLAGGAILLIAKNNRMLRSFGAGVLIGGLANIFRDIVGNVAGMVSEPKDAFAEERVTWGGIDGGTSVTSPDRRVIT